jgi:signal transduction histidine kinase
MTSFPSAAGARAPSCASRVLAASVLLPLQFEAQGTPGSGLHPLSLYLLPLALAAVMILFAAWRNLRTRACLLARELEQAQNQARQLEHERDLAQDELFRRLYEERELNKEKVQFQAQLSEYEKYAALAQLALGAAHEINNPLLGILSHLELELKRAQSDEERSEITQCIEGAKRISSTLRSLLNYARPGPLVLSRISLHRLVADAVTFLENQPMLHGKMLCNRVPPSLPLIYADSSQLSQVLMNLLLNAAEATPQGGQIRIEADKLALVDSIEIRVIDTGCGIPPDVLNHVFEPFFTTKRGKGTGLGLSISQTYVRSHGGDIRVASVVGSGTTVTVTLPVRPPNVPEAEKEESRLVV